MKRILVAAMAAIAALVVLSAPASSTRRPSCPRPPDLPSPANFSDGIDNRYLPLTPGTTLTYRGKLDGQPAKDVFSVTDQTKEILGVTTTVIHDQVFIKGELTEDTEDWFAQDMDGNVWYFGEDTKELENGQVVSTEGSWEAGVNNARAGIFMPAAPAVGQVNKQEDAKNVAEDCARIVDLNASVKTPFVSADEGCSTTSTTSATSAWCASRPSRAAPTCWSSSRSGAPDRTDTKASALRAALEIRSRPPDVMRSGGRRSLRNETPA
jgi:hypothetical protein